MALTTMQESSGRSQLCKWYNNGNTLVAFWCSEEGDVLANRFLNADEYIHLLDGTKRVKATIARVLFACVDRGARIGVALVERDKFRGRFVPPTHTQHQLVKKCLIEHIGHLSVAQIMCDYAVKDFPKQQVQTRSSQMHAVRVCANPALNDPHEVVVTQAIPAKQPTRCALENGFLHGLLTFDPLNAIHVFSLFVDR
eukprot:scaffold1440_cov332-Pavlova_lutheri.AAC.36